MEMETEMKKHLPTASWAKLAKGLSRTIATIVDGSSGSRFEVLAEGILFGSTSGAAAPAPEVLFAPVAALAAVSAAAFVAAAKAASPPEARLIMNFPADAACCAVVGFAVTPSVGHWQSNEATAPMLLPHRATWETAGWLCKCLTTALNVKTFLPS